MTDDPNELTIDNSAVVLIDHQPWVAFGVQSIDRGVLVNNVAGVDFVSNCSGGVSEEAHDDATARMIQADAKPVTWVSVVCEWAPDYTSPERGLLNEVVLQRGGAVGLADEYMVAQLSAGLVPAPFWATEPAR
jgi:hypothetical protein